MSPSAGTSLGEGHIRAAQVRPALRRVTVAWMFGAAWLAITTSPALASFLKQYLGASDLAYGLISAAAPAARVCLLLGSYAVERSGQSKPLFLWFGAWQRLIWLVPAAAPWLLAWLGREVTLVLVALALFIASATGALGGAGWWVWMSALVPAHAAGRYFGRRSRIGLVVMVLSTLAAALVFERWPGQGWVYALIFGVAAVLGTIDILLFIRVPEPSRQVPGEPRPTLSEILVLPWRDAAWRSTARYIAFAMLGYAVTNTFIAPFCLAPVSENGLGLSVLQTMAILVWLQLLCSAWVAPVWGRVIDRYGPKSALRASTLAALVMPIWWFFSHRGGPTWSDTLWLMPASMLFGGILVGGFDQAMAYAQLRAFPLHRRSAYVASFQVLLSLATMLGSALAGVLAQWFADILPTISGRPPWLSHYHLLFVVSFVLRLIAFVAMFAAVPLSGRAGAVAVYRTVVGDLLRTLAPPPRLRHGGPRR